MLLGPKPLCQLLPILYQASNDQHRVFVVTGAFGYTGRYIAPTPPQRRRNRPHPYPKPGIGQPLRRQEVERNLTRNSANFSPFGGRVERHPLDFNDASPLRESLHGADTLYNTYWIRFARGPVNHDTAVRNTRNLDGCSRRPLRVRRIVHVSITNAGGWIRPYPTSVAKVLVENHIRESGLSYSIIRPTVIFGREDILINNIAWFLRRFPVYSPSPDEATTACNPCIVDDVARLAVESASAQGNTTLDAVGPRDLHLSRNWCKSGPPNHGRPRPPAPPTSCAGLFRRHPGRPRPARRGADPRRNRRSDGRATWYQQTHPREPCSLTDWMRQHRDTLGHRYASELTRHYR